MNNKIVNFVFVLTAFNNAFNMYNKKRQHYLNVSYKIDLPRVHWDETEFSLDPPLPVVVPLFHKQNDRHYNCRESFFCHEAL